MTMTTTRKLLWTTVLGLGLSLGACDKGDTEGKTASKDAKDKKGGDLKTPADAKKPGDVKVEPPADEPLDERVVKAAGLAKKIEADPAKADDILAEAGLDRASFDALIYEVSAPELAEQYRLARARES
jgi:hypothetical protein